MPSIAILFAGAGAPELMGLDTWQILTSRPVFCAVDDPLGALLKERGFPVAELTEADQAAIESPRMPSRDLPLLTHGHGEISDPARRLAGRLADLALEHGSIAYVAHDESLTRAMLERGMRGDVEVEFVMGAVPRGSRLLELVQVMARLRGPGGCPWDAEQTHQSLAKHLLDETYELLEAIEGGSDGDIAEELGDLLLQVVFHSQMGADAGTFDIDDVAGLLIDKLIRRHPHVFGDVQVSGAGEVVANWDEIKRHEKERTSAVEGVPESLPALAYAQKLQRRASAAGFDWDDAGGALAKVREEAEELARAPDDGAREAELGDLLFAMVSLGRHLGIDAETALRRASRRFSERLQGVEQAARERGAQLADLSEDELEALWREVKR
jgi:nucleoside triphosphate diphosphatase